MADLKAVYAPGKGYLIPVGGDPPARPWGQPVPSQTPAPGSAQCGDRNGTFSDGCNSCRITNGSVACSKMACPGGSRYPTWVQDEIRLCSKRKTSAGKCGDRNGEFSDGCASCFVFYGRIGCNKATSCRAGAVRAIPAWVQEEQRKCAAGVKCGQCKVVNGVRTCVPCTAKAQAPLDQEMLAARVWEEAVVQRAGDAWQVAA